MFEGRVAYHGPPAALSHYFSVENAEDIYPRLAKRSPDRWHTSWAKNRDTYYRALTKINDAETERERFRFYMDHYGVEPEPSN